MLVCAGSTQSVYSAQLVSQLTCDEMMRVIAWPAFKTKYKNPYTWLLYSRMAQWDVVVEEFSVKQALRQRYDIFHLHWPVETIVRHPNWMIAGLRAILMLLTLDWLRLRGTQIVWTIHDETPHSIVHPRLANWFQKAYMRRVDGCISLCEVSQEFVSKTFPGFDQLPHAIVPHGHYRDVYANRSDRSAAQSALGISQEQHVLLFLGYIDYYKNVPHLIQTFKSLAPQDWVLVIAGRVEVPELKQEILNLADGNDSIRLHLKFIPDDDLQYYFNAADLVVLPFAEILNSGSALLALSFNRPILVPQKGALMSLQEWVGSDWIRLYEGNLNANNLANGLDWALKTERSEEADLRALEWDRVSHQTVSFYQRLWQGN